MAARPPIKSTVIIPTDNLNKQTNNEDIALEIVKSYLASGAYKSNKLNTTDEVSRPAIDSAARRDAYYIAGLFVQTKALLDKFYVK